MPSVTRITRRDLFHAGAIALSLMSSGLTAGAWTAQADKKEAQDRILFVSDREKPDAYAIYSMNPDGSNQTRLSKGEEAFFDPSWSPDHKRILFSRVANVEKRTTSLCIMKADGSDVTVLSPGEEQIIYVAPSWSPDGRHIAYSAVHAGASDIAAVIYIIDPDGKNRKKLVDGVAPVWSPDSQHLLFSPLNASGAPTLNTIDRDGTNVKILAPKGFGAAWSPDGKRIAYTGERDNGPALFVMDADGSHSTLLTKDADTVAIGPVWTADGKHIAYTRLPKGVTGRPQLAMWLMDADGGNARAVTEANSFVGPGTSMFFVLRAVWK